MRPATIRAFAFGMIAGSLLTATVIAAAPAKADISETDILHYAGPVCAVITEYPTDAGILGVGTALVDDGYTPSDAGRIIAYSIATICPQNLHVLNHFTA